MSRTMKERMRSREGIIAAWVLVAVAWGALALMSMAVGFSSLFGTGLPNVSILQSLLIGAVATMAMVFGIIARHTYPVAASIPAFLAAPLVLIFGVGGLIAVFWLVFMSLAA
ncbi:hypothetical protein P0L94_07145 [Microbacter sp. GSS18]|nr:hypothetical protein P0L94_07145 [Microbacter sp. GSS18]